MNNIYLNNDPLLYNKPMGLSDIGSQAPSYDYYSAYQQKQPDIPQYKDYLTDLDNELKSLDASSIDLLNSNAEFTKLNVDLQKTIQFELINLIRNRLNANPSVSDNIRKQIELIKTTTNEAKEAERQNLYELNDYMKNYSHLTFDEYKKIKNGDKPTKNNKK